MAITTNRMDWQSRVPLPGLSGQDFGTWREQYGHLVLSRTRNAKLNQYIILDEVVVITKEIVVHHFTMGDVDDPDLYAAEPLYQWQISEQGKWVMERALETPVWHRITDPTSFGYRYTVTATFQEKYVTEFYLRWGNANT